MPSDGLNQEIRTCLFIELDATMEKPDSKQLHCIMDIANSPSADSSARRVSAQERTRWYGSAGSGPSRIALAMAMAYETFPWRQTGC